jgi:OOP family OmpA-OmpF porin
MEEENMKRRTINLVLAVCLAAGIAGPLGAAEIITEEDIRQGIITEEHLVRVADNALFILDTSRSMNKPLEGTDKSRFDAIVDELKARNSYLPQLGHKFGLYLADSWTPVYEMRSYDRDAFGAALASLPEKGKGPTPMLDALESSEDVLKTLSGKTAMIVFSDGTYSRGSDRDKPRPVEVAKRLVDNYDVCIYVISVAKEKHYQKMLQNVGDLNACSRVIPLTRFLDRPEYTTGALFKVKATEYLVTATEKRIVGLEADDATFEFDKSDIRTPDMNELDEVGEFLRNQLEAFVVLSGYTDNVGSEEYNLTLSRRRAESVADYLVDRYGVDMERIVLQWHGYANPVASNDTEEGRAKNRRVEMAVGGL